LTNLFPNAFAFQMLFLVEPVANTYESSPS
jgi:hypothetical protein